MPHTSSLSDWSAEQVATGKKWIQAWRAAAPELERVHREELRQLDSLRALSLLCGFLDYTIPPRAAKPTSGLVEQQRWFRKALFRD